MLFLHAILFYVLVASVMAFPVSPPSSHLVRGALKTSGDSDLDGHWLCITGKSIQNHIISIKNNQILEAFPKLEDPIVDLQSTGWKRAAKDSIKNLHLPSKLMENIPNKAPKDELEIQEYKDRRDLKRFGSMGPWENKKLILEEHLWPAQAR
ncbi:hypothetical protein F5887DRAFT_986380 [Amanita rubescens]|nr:hypothetical protein F5887DRAFT_986380 [Amanita rubescens]